MPEDPSTPSSHERPGAPADGESETVLGEGSTVLRDPAPRPHETVGDFEVMAKLGQGGMGAVYRARQIPLDREVALKILPASLEADEDYVARFQREACFAASLNHANLVRVYASGEADGCHYIAMELIEGETLSQRLRRGPLPPLEALGIILDVARALEYGWRTAQLIHRDIKPGNIFLAAEGHVKLGDLGLAKIVGADTTGLTQTGIAMGTPHYISPEQARGEKDLDCRTDIYSLGCTLYQMLTGHTPYLGTEPMVVMSQHINAPAPAILKEMPQCPLLLARLVSKMMKKIRRERYGSYEELIVAIENVRAQIDPTFAGATASPPAGPSPTTLSEVWTGRRTGGAPGTPADPSPPTKSRVPLYVGLAAVGIVLGVGAWLIGPLAGKHATAPDRAPASSAPAAVESPAPAVSEPARSGSDSPPVKNAASAPATPAVVTTPVTTPGGATKDAPFINTLGMRFVPVPGAKVLFSVWDTRMRDYGAFIRETKRSWPKPEFKQGPEHPVVMVSWGEAEAFCRWLTAREQAAGRLPGEWSYRLPGDHEWSCAVGIGDREDPAKLPSEKDHQLTDIFPWGTEWPPPDQAGNYWSEELRPLLAAGMFPWIKKELTGRHDGFATTAPVGSYPANACGLYDMGGNVWQWCEDWFNAAQRERVMRGGAWDTRERSTLLSSARLHYAPNSRYNGIGFRCVLGASDR